MLRIFAKMVDLTVAMKKSKSVDIVTENQRFWTSLWNPNLTNNWVSVPVFKWVTGDTVNSSTQWIFSCELFPNIILVAVKAFVSVCRFCHMRKAKFVGFIPYSIIAQQKSLLWSRSRNICLSFAVGGSCGRHRNFSPAFNINQSVNLCHRQARSILNVHVVSHIWLFCQSIAVVSFWVEVQNLVFACMHSMIICWKTSLSVYPFCSPVSTKCTASLQTSSSVPYLPRYELVTRSGLNNTSIYS